MSASEPQSETYDDSDLSSFNYWGNWSSTTTDPSSFNSTSHATVGVGPAYVDVRFSGANGAVVGSVGVQSGRYYCRMMDEELQSGVWGWFDGASNTNVSDKVLCAASGLSEDGTHSMRVGLAGDDSGVIDIDFFSLNTTLSGAAPANSGLVWMSEFSTTAPPPVFANTTSAATTGSSTTSTASSIVTASTATSATSTSKPTTSANDHSSTHVAVIAGATVGGVAFLALLLAAVILIRRKGKSGNPTEGSSAYGGAIHLRDVDQTSSSKGWGHSSQVSLGGNGGDYDDEEDDYDTEDEDEYWDNYYENWESPDCFLARAARVNKQAFLPVAREVLYKSLDIGSYDTSEKKEYALAVHRHLQPLVTHAHVNFGTGDREPLTVALSFARALVLCINLSTLTVVSFEVEEEFPAILDLLMTYQPPLRELRLHFAKRQKPRVTFSDLAKLLSTQPLLQKLELPALPSFSDVPPAEPITFKLKSLEVRFPAGYGEDKVSAAFEYLANSSQQTLETLTFGHEDAADCSLSKLTNLKRMTWAYSGDRNSDDCPKHLHYLAIQVSKLKLRHLELRWPSRLRFVPLPLLLRSPTILTLPVFPLLGTLGNLQTFANDPHSAFKGSLRTLRLVSRYEKRQERPWTPFTFIETAKRARALGIQVELDGERFI
ncbi:hypothetical protein MNV49_002996 [Pseudohyphozyma bogoriensis]|nr:hypothetical protein MNV49_002996 [Pseudohyphozyma bogoriensis]